MKRTSNRGATDLIERREEFTNSTGSFTGTTFPTTVGELPEPWREEFYQRRNDIVYAVMSYRTPIGWVYADGEVVCPDVTYSITTSGRHQGPARQGLGIPYGPLTRYRPGATYRATAMPKGKRSGRTPVLAGVGAHRVWQAERNLSGEWSRFEWEMEAAS